MEKCVHQNTVDKIKQNTFLHLPCMDSTNLELMPCSKLDSVRVQLIKHK